jgi:hypothetical protein
MALTLQAIDSVPEVDRAPEWTFGGGTSLAIDLGHRISYDIDAFVDSAKVIQALVPVSNETTKSICWNRHTGRADFQWPGHYLKLIVLDTGEIDFLSSAALVDDPVVPFDFEGRTIKRERPAEVIAKKIYYRGASFKARDVFDLAGTFIVKPDELSVAAGSPYISAEIIARARLRIRLREREFAEEILEETNPTDFGTSYLSDACGLALQALDFMEGNAP